MFATATISFVLFLPHCFNKGADSSTETDYYFLLTELTFLRDGIGKNGTFWKNLLYMYTIIFSRDDSENVTLQTLNRAARLRNYLS